MDKITGNEPAIPVEVTLQSDGTMAGSQTSNFSGFSIGLTIRQHYAGLAMQGLLAGHEGPERPWEGTPEALAIRAVEIADALIAALNSKPL
jgi:hypothetical protein